jgi:hypothetical protein
MFMPSRLLFLLLFLSACAELPRTPEVSYAEIQQSPVEDKQIEKKEYTVLVGKLMEQEYVPDIQTSSCLKENVICMGSFYLYKINIQQVISGEPLAGIIKVARYQHAEYMYRGSDNAIFVIERITNKKTSQLLKTNHFITEYIAPKVTYCLSKKLDKYIPEFKEPLYSNCLLQRDVYGGLKDDLIELVDTRVERELINKKILIKHNYDFSDGANIISDDYDDDDACPSYVDLDKYDTDENCILDDGIDGIEGYEVKIYQVKKGKAPCVKQLILDELSKIKINLGHVKMNFQIIEGENKSILYWHTRVGYLR